MLQHFNRCKREFYRASIEESKGQPSKMCKSINEILKRDKKSSAPRMIRVDGWRDIKDSLGIAESFCGYFSNIAAKYRLKSPSIKPGFKKLKQFIEERLHHDTRFQIPNVTEDFVNSQLLKFKTNTAVGIQNGGGLTIG